MAHLDRRRHAAPRGAGVAARAAALAFAALLGPAAAAPQVDEGPNANLFQLYDTQAARARAAKAEEHMAGARWAEAIAELQALIEEHDGEVLGGRRPRAAGAEHPSQQDVHPGAGSWAVDRLFELPPEGREVYRRRYGPRAADALRRAVAEADRGALARIAQRWPVTDAAARAWWALGDLEVELGHLDDGVRAWARAAAVELDQPGRRCRSAADWDALAADVAAAVEADDLPAGAAPRMGFALELQRGGAGDDGPRTEASFVNGPARGVAADSFGVRSTSGRPPLGADGVSGWPVPFALPPGPFNTSAGSSRVFPQRHGDLVYVNTSRSLHALGAFDGVEAWRIGSDRLDWDGVRNLNDFEAAVDVQEHIVTVAASRGIVVAPLQIPVVYEERDQFQDLKIIDVIPERRLIACDAETGDVLWTTMPPVGWDGESGSFKDRMTVVGPPTIVGARVLVPMARLRGRIELHLGCLDLTDGSVLWSAPLVTGQRELNMFGRATKEFSAPAPVVVGDTVVMQTQLGLIAAVDLFTGETLWDTVYEQVHVNPPEFYAAGWIESRWRNAAPVVTGDTIVAAPQDAMDLLALDVATGAVLWTFDQVELMRRLAAYSNVKKQYPRRRAVSVLLGADEERVYVGGAHVLAIEFPRGVRVGPPVERAWMWPEDRILMPEVGVPVLDQGSVFVPDMTRLARLDRETGRVEEVVEGTVASGNVLVSEGMLFGSNGRRVEARFEWRAMVERARDAALAEGAAIPEATTLSRLLLERAEGLLSDGREVERATRLAEEARDALERFGAHGEPGLAPTAASRALAPEMHRANMCLVRGARLLGRRDAARSRCRVALALAGDPAHRLEALLVLHELEGRARDGEPAALLAEILAGHGDQPVRVTARAPAGGAWDAQQAYRDVVIARGEGAPERLADPWTDPWRGRPVPVAALLADDERPRGPGSGYTEADVPARLFVRLAQVIEARGAAALEARLSGELDALHAVLEESPDADLFGTSSGLWAAGRIHAMRVLWPDSQAVAAIDRRAEEALADALDVARATGAAGGLELLPVLFPGSPAARRADDERIEFAFTNGLAEDVAALVTEALPQDWHPARSSERDTRMLLRLAEILGENGNRALRAGIARSLARFSPDLDVERPTSLPGSGPVTLSALADAWEARVDSPPPAPVPSFDTTVVGQELIKGSYGSAGRGVLEDGTPVALMASARELMAIPAGGGGQPLWRRPVELSGTASRRARQVVVDGPRVLVVDDRELLCLSLAKGTVEWRFVAPDRGLEGIWVDSGVCVVLASALGARPVPAEVHALDTAAGIELWQLGSIRDYYQSTLQVGEGRLVLFPLKAETAAVHDLFTGFPVAAVETGRLTPRQSAPAWIDRGRLVVPFIDGAASRKIQNAIVAYELDDGSEAWRIDLDRYRGAERQLLGIVDMPDGAGGRARLAMLRDATGGPAAGGFSLHVIDEERGRFGLAPRHVVEAGEELYGVPPRTRVVLDAPLLLVAAESATSGATLLEALGPDLEPLWKVSSPRRVLVRGAQNKPLPAVGRDVVALVVAESFGPRANPGVELKLMFLDAGTGKHLETRRLDVDDDRRRSWQTLEGFGGTLVAAGSGLMQILEKPRSR